MFDLSTVNDRAVPPHVVFPLSSRERCTVGDDSRLQDEICVFEMYLLRDAKQCILLLRAPSLND